MVSEVFLAFPLHISPPLLFWDYELGAKVYRVVLVIFSFYARTDYSVKYCGEIQMLFTRTKLLSGELMSVLDKNFQIRLKETIKFDYLTRASRFYCDKGFVIFVSCLCIIPVFYFITKSSSSPIFDHIILETRGFFFNLWDQPSTSLDLVMGSDLSWYCYIKSEREKIVRWKLC